MKSHHVQLVDQHHTLLADAQVVDEDGCFRGTINLQATPTLIRLLFEEFEEIVDGQMFAFLDDIEEKIDSVSIKPSLMMDSRWTSETCKSSPAPAICHFA